MIDRDRYFTVCTIVITRTEEAPEPRSPFLWPTVASLAVLGLSVIPVVLVVRVIGLVVGW